MKKIFILLACLLPLLMLSACTLKKGTETTQIEETQEKTGVFESIKDAMSRSLSLKCEYNSPSGKVIASIKGKSVRIDGAWQNQSDSGAIIKENKLWSWDKEKKEGIIITLADQENTDKSLDPEEIINNLEQRKQDCHVAVVADEVFEPPTDIKFQDLSELMKQFGQSPSPAILLEPETQSEELEE